MQNKFTNIIKNIPVLAIMILGMLFFSVSAGFIFMSPAGQGEQTELSFEEMSIEELFIAGEYYFNHQENEEEYNLSKARQYYTELIRRDPKGHSAVWYQLGRIDFIEGYFDDALFKFKKQEEYFSESGINSYYMIGLVYGYRARETGDELDWNLAAEAFEKFITFAPNAPWPRVDLAWVYFAQGKYEEIGLVVQAGLEKHPDNAWLLNMQGLHFLNTQEYTKAKASFLEAADSAGKLTTWQWGSSYPGNNPDDWARGLAEFQEAIDKNIILVDEKLKS